MSLSSLPRKILGPIIPIVRTQGMINDLSVTKLEHSLANINVGRSQAVALLINSPGGYVAPCQTMIDILRIYTKKHHLPLYTFAEDMALSGGYFLLVAGDKVYADKTSWVGSIGALTQTIDAQNLLRKYKIDVKTWRSSDNLMMPALDPLADTNKENAHKSLRKLSESVHEKFIEHVESYRDRKISVPKEERKEKLYQADIWTGKESVNLGLVDGIGTYQEVLTREFPDAKLVEVTKTSFAEAIRERAALISSLDEASIVANVAKKMGLAFGQK